MEFRKDAVSIKGSPHIDDFGILRVRAVIARIGVQEYMNKDGTIRREFRPPEEVQKSTKTLDRVPIPIGHPNVMMTADNNQDLQKGLTSNVSYDDGLVYSDLTITTSDGVQAALTTHRQLSCGYYCDLEESSGIWVDELGLRGTKGQSYEYDYIQRNIVGNHVALVTRARAGDVATILDSRTDFADTIICQDLKKNKNMVKIVHDNRVFEIDGSDADGISEVIKTIKVDADNLRSQLTESVVKLSEKESELTAMSAKVDALELQIKQLQETKINQDEINAKVAQLTQLWAEAKSLVADCAPDYSLSETQVKALVLSKIAPDLSEKVNKADAAYINALWENKELFIPKSSAEPLKEIAEKTTNNDAKKPVDGKMDAMKRTQRLGKFK